jgi:predicted secreted protein
MAKEYRVDLDALDQVVKELNGVLKDMNGTKGKAGSGTYLPSSALGKKYREHEMLHKAHTDMKTFIENEIVAKIEKLVDDFGKKSKKTKEAYDDAEHQNKIH